MVMGLELLCDNYVLIVLVAILFPALHYWYSTRNNDYWKKRGVPFAKPYPLSYLIEYYLKGFAKVDNERYNCYGKVYGFYEGRTPLISISDPELIKNILVKDFSNFTNRRLPSRYVLVGCKDKQTGDPIADKMLTVIRGEDWKRIRMIVSPTFTTGKIKNVMNIFQDSSKTMLQNMKAEIANKSFIEAQRFYGAFTMDVITSTSFTVKVDSLKNPENMFVKMASNILSPDINWKKILYFLAPRLSKLFGLHLFASENAFFKKVTLQLIQERRKLGLVRNDFLQLLLDAVDEKLKQNNSVETDDDFPTDFVDDTMDKSIFKETNMKQLSMDELVAQCVIFFISGFHTTTVTLSAVTYLLTVNQDEQEKVFQEIKTVLKETNGVITHEAVKKMTYLDTVMYEAMRLYQPGNRLYRETEADYKLGDTGITIPKGITVSIPVFCIHRDPNFFPEPEKFKPNRFSPEEKKNIIPYTYLPFGAGPRTCVAYRFAFIEMKVCLIHVFSAFHVKKCSETQVPLGIARGTGPTTLNPVRVYLEERKDCPLIL